MLRRCVIALALALAIGLARRTGGGRLSADRAVQAGGQVDGGSPGSRRGDPRVRHRQEGSPYYPSASAPGRAVPRQRGVHGGADRVHLGGRRAAAGRVRRRLHQPRDRVREAARAVRDPPADRLPPGRLRTTAITPASECSEHRVCCRQRRRRADVGGPGHLGRQRLRGLLGQQTGLGRDWNPDAFHQRVGARRADARPQLGVKGVLGLDPFNEPYPGTGYPSPAATSRRAPAFEERSFPPSTSR